MKDYNCIYNEETSTLRIERVDAKLIPGDTCVMKTDIISIKVFISFVCDRYAAPGTNTTYLSGYDIQKLAFDLKAYEEIYNEIIPTLLLDDLENEEWRV